MIKEFLALGFLIALAGASVADEGTVLEVTTDTIKIKGGVNTQTFVVSNELLTNTISGCHIYNKFTEVKKGSKVELDWVMEDGRRICTLILLEDPDDAGIVTEVGKGSITIRNDKGKTTAYKVAKDLVNNSRLAARYTTNYPTRFADVKPGCRIEIVCYTVDGEVAITGMDVKKEKEKDK